MAARIGCKRMTLAWINRPQMLYYNQHLDLLKRPFFQPSLEITPMFFVFFTGQT